MKRTILTIGMTSLLVIGFSGCTKTSGSVNVAKANAQSVKQDIKIGITTKEQLINMYGDPLIKNKINGLEHWQFVYRESQMKNRNLIPFVGLFTGDKTKIKTNIIKVTFNKNDTVKSVKFEQQNQAIGVGDVFKMKMK